MRMSPGLQSLLLLLPLPSVLLLLLPTPCRNSSRLSKRTVMLSVAVTLLHRDSQHQHKRFS
jgi:hypothetical protein